MNRYYRFVEQHNLDLKTERLFVSREARILQVHISHSCPAENYRLLFHAQVFSRVFPLVGHRLVCVLEQSESWIKHIPRLPLINVQAFVFKYHLEVVCLSDVV